MISLTETVIPSDTDLREAISLYCSPVLGALAVANALGGIATIPWKLLHNVRPLTKLFDEAKQRNLDLNTLECAVDGGLVKDSRYYQEWAYGPRKMRFLIQDIRDWENEGGAV